MDVVVSEVKNLETERIIRFGVHSLNDIDNESQLRFSRRPRRRVARHNTHTTNICGRRQHAEHRADSNLAIFEFHIAAYGEIPQIRILAGGGERSLCCASFDRGDPVRIRHGIRVGLRPLRTGVDGRFVHVDDESAGRCPVPADYSGLVGTIADDLDLAGAHHRVQRLNGRQQRRVSGDRRFSFGKCGESLEDYILGI